MNRNNEPVGLALRGDVVQVICRNTDLVGLIDCNRHDRNMFELKHVCDTANLKHCPRSSQLHVPAYALTKYGADKGPRSRIGVSVLRYLPLILQYLQPIKRRRLGAMNARKSDQHYTVEYNILGGFHYRLSLHGINFTHWKVEAVRVSCTLLVLNAEACQSPCLLVGKAVGTLPTRIRIAFSSHGMIICDVWIRRHSPDLRPTQT